MQGNKKQTVVCFKVKIIPNISFTVFLSDAVWKKYYHGNMSRLRLVIYAPKVAQITFVWSHKILKSSNYLRKAA